VDLTLPLEDLSLSFYDNLLVRLSPYGPGNMLPNFVSGATLTRPPVIMKEDHLKIYVGDYEAVGFGMRKDFYEGLVEAYEQHQAIQIVYHLDINEFMGQRKLQLRLLDVGL
jgi:single-stranded-DNA-specific exonuclease